MPSEEAGERRGNLLADLPVRLADELVEVLVADAAVRIERIVSRGHASPPGFWYEQAEAEWVLLLAGRAGVRFEDGAMHTLQPGDWLEIPAHARHRVEWTEPDIDTIWLAVFRRAGDAGPGADKAAGRTGDVPAGDRGR